MFKDGKYGFVDPPEFSSVVDLVAFYQTKTLAHYNAKLDVTLSDPLSKFDQVGTQFVSFDLVAGGD